MARPRLDQALVQQGLCPSREQAKRLILAGQVLVNDQPGLKPGSLIPLDAILRVKEPPRYVSRGGLKLEGALNHFQIDVTGLIALDVGASTGGFTDCLLQHGATSVHAVDVGHGQLAWKLRQDPRVVVLERTNARELTPAHFAPGATPFDVVVVDCSFISLRRILPPVPGLLRPGGHILALVKPQFEAGKAEADRGAGVISDPAVHARVLTELEAFVHAELPTLRWLGHVESPLLGPAGNREFLAHITALP
jgi:23S rRNA (cytidine1920-2'-O)/16S rRNA (cytidine1409-2'-O)-methyltransferase